jgi:hypothetical protein
MFLVGLEHNAKDVQKIIDWGIARLLYYDDDGEMLHMKQPRELTWLCQLRRGYLMNRGLDNTIATALHGISVIMMDGNGPEELKLRSIHEFDTATVVNFDQSMQELRTELSRLRKYIHRSLSKRSLNLKRYQKDTNQEITRNHCRIQTVEAQNH